MMSSLYCRKKRKRRDQICIIADIVFIVKKGALKTQIMYRANLSFSQLNEYLAFLLDANLIMEAFSEGKEIYMISRKGTAFLKAYRELTKIIESKTDYTQDKRLSQTLIVSTEI